MSLNQDISSVEAVLNSVGTTLVHRAEHRSSPQALNENGIHARTSEPPRSPFDVGSRLAKGSAADLDALSKDFGSFRGHSRLILPDSTKEEILSGKRKRMDCVSDAEQQTEYVYGGRQYEKGQSRDLMPPPPIPNRQPHIYMSQVPDASLHELLRQNQNGGASGLPWGVTPFNPDRQHHPRNLDGELNASGSPHPAAPQYAANNNYDLAPSIIGTPPPRIPTAAEPPPYSALPRQTAQGDNAQHRGGQSSTLPAFSPYNGRQCPPPSPNQGSLQARLNGAGINQTHGSNFGRYGSGNSLGLSVNSRSSGQRLSLSPANAGGHRQRLGEAPSASPHFQPRALSNSNSRSPWNAQSPPQLRRYASNATTLIGSLGPRPVHHDRNFLVEQDDRIEASHNRGARGSFASDTETLVGSIRPGPFTHNVDRGRALLVDPQTPGYRRSDPSRGRMLTADPRASAARRRVNR